MSDWRETPLSTTLGIEYPIIQGGFGGFRSQALTSEVSRWGGLGTFGAHGLDAHEITDVVHELRSLCTRPFAINLWVSMDDAGAAASDRAAFERSLAVLAPHLHELGGELPSWKPYVPRRFEDQARAVIDARVPVLSFICGVPPTEILQACRDARIRTIGTATTPDEAIALAEAGVDVVVASGFEAGGHRGSFLRRAEESLIGTFALVPQVADAVDVPVAAAGGVSDARGLLAAFALGAHGVQLGTALLACSGSGASASHRAAITTRRFTPTGLTKGYTGRLARGVRNRLMDELEASGVEVLPYPLQRALVRSLTALAERAGRSDLQPMWAGQSAGLARGGDATTFLSQLASQVDAIAGELLGWNLDRRHAAREV